MKLSILFLMGWSLAGCRSEDLGKQDPDTVALTSATWEGGISELITKKCADCHSPNRSEFVPTNTPNTIDSIGTKNFWNSPRSLSRIRLIRSRFNDTPDTPMPPRYGTPFSENERAMYLAYIDERIKSLTNSSGTTTTCAGAPDWNDSIAATVASNCASAGCHATASPGIPALTTQAQWLANRDVARSLIRSGSMPKGVPNFGNTDGGKILLGTSGC